MADVLAWHFLPEDRRLRYYPHTLVKPGQTLRVYGPLLMCDRGLHASRRVLDALFYAPGPIACRVLLSGKILEDPDKLCASKRKCLWMVDATRVLHEFACWCAEQALLKEREAGREPDPRSWAAIDTKRKWLRGEATDDELYAARDAAWAASTHTAGNIAWSAVGGAATDAAWGAAWSVAAHAASDAAKSATLVSDWSAAWDAARDAVWDAQNAELERRLIEAHEAEGRAESARSEG